MKKSKIPPGFTPILALVLVLLVATAGFLIFSKYQLVPKNPSNTPTVTPTLTPSATSIPSPNPTANWKTYTSNLLKISFKYPSDWLGPEEYVYKTGGVVGIGTSKPHKYGEDISLDYPSKDSYFVTLQVNLRNIPVVEWDKQPWMADINESINLKQGESANSHGMRKTKVKDIAVDSRKASEIIVDNSPNEGTEFVYETQIIIKDPEFVMTIKSSPVVISGTSSERLSKAKSINQAYSEIFDQILSGFRFLN